MLYDPKWDKLSLSSLIAWLETKDPNERYDFNNMCGECMFGQYMKAVGIPWSFGPRSNYAMVQDFFGATIALGDVRRRHFDFLREWTFGAALTRARALAE